MRQLLSDHGVQWLDRGKNISQGWIGMKCPFCDDDPSHHLGWNEEKGYFYCWRCGYHSVIETVARLLTVSYKKAHKIIKQYSDIRAAPTTKPKNRPIKPLSLPTDTYNRLLPTHRKYLKSRGFDPDRIRRLWKIKSCGPTSTLDKIDYKNRILIPIYWRRVLVSFQTRAPKDGIEPRYKTCPPSHEIVHHKHILYGRQQDWKETGICVEGVTDVWRLGPASFCTFGVSFTKQQVRQIAKHFKRVAVIYDNDTPGQTKADALVSELRFRGIKAEKIIIPNDPASLSDDDARHLVQQVLKWGKVK